MNHDENEINFGEKRKREFTLGVMKTLSGSVKEFMEEIKTIPQIQKIEQREKKEFRKEILTEVVTNIRRGFEEKSKERVLSSLDSLSQIDQQNHSIFGMRVTKGANSFPRIQISQGVYLPSAPAVKTLSPSLYSDQKTIITPFIRNIEDRQWKKQGTGCYSVVEEYVFERLQKLWSGSKMKKDTLKDPLIIFLSFSTDGSKLGKCQSSTHMSILLSLLMDTEIWENSCENELRSPLPFLLVSDRENTDTMLWAGKQITNSIERLHSCRWFFNRTRGFLKESPTDHDNSNQPNSSPPTLVSLRVFLLCGDCKTQQILAGSNVGKSFYRCFCCFKSAHEWFNSVDTFSLRLPERTISSGFLKHQENYRGGVSVQGQKEELKATPRVSSLIPDLLSNEKEIENYFYDHHLWSLWITADPLHIVEGHSAELMKPLFKTWKNRPEGKIISSLLRQHCDVEFGASKLPGWKWRYVWGSLPLTWSQVFEEKSEEYGIIYSWTKCCSYMYENIEKRSLGRWFKFFAWSMKHFLLWRKSALHKPSLYFHLFWSHMIEQGFWVGFASTTTELHEYNWVTLKKLWRSCGSTPKSTELLFKRWIGFLETTWKNKKQKKIISLSSITQVVGEFSKKKPAGYNLRRRE